jgi:hypothetical protein
LFHVVACACALVGTLRACYCVFFSIDDVFDCIQAWR